MFIDPTFRNHFLKNLTHDDFRELGEGQVAYVRPISLLGLTQYTVHGASGAELMTVPSLAHVNLVAAEKQLEVITVH